MSWRWERNSWRGIRVKPLRYRQRTPWT